MTYTLTGRYPLGDLTGREERLRFTPSTAIVSSTDGNIILPAPVEVTLDAAGEFSVDLVGTDDAAYAPTGWVWTVTELMTGGRAPWSFELTADADLSTLTTVPTPDDPNLYVPVTRTLTAGAGLTGGGTMAADRTFAVGAGTGVQVNADTVEVVYGSTAGTAAEGSALTAEAAARVAGDAADAAALAAHAADTTSIHGIADTAALETIGHAAKHAAAGSDPVTVAESQVTGLTAALAAKADDATTITAGAGLTGGGDLSANRTLAVGAGTGITVNADDIAVAYGTTAGTAAQGNDSRITGAIQSTVADANSVLYAVTDNTPAALTVAASRLVGRGTTGDIAALTAATVRADFDLAQASAVCNMLTANQAACVSGFTASMPIVYNGDGTATCTYSATGAGTVLIGLLPVTVGQPFTVQAQFTAVSGRLTRARILFKNASNGYVSGGDVFGNSIAAGATGISTATMVAPATAVTAEVYVNYSGTGSIGDAFTFTQPGFWRGAGGQWALPAMPIVNLGSRANPANTAQVQVWNPGNVTWITV